MVDLPAHLLFLAQVSGNDPPYGPVEPEPETAIWPYLAFGLLALALLGGLAWLVRYLLRQHRPATPPAEHRARFRLDRIERDGGSMPPNQFALAISDVLKDFLTERFSDPVRYETTEEFLRRSAGDGTTLPEVVRRNLGEFLAHADEVKFANRSDAAVSAQTLLGLGREILSLCRTVGRDGK